MRKYIILLFLAFCFIGCNANTEIEESKSYPKLKVVNQKTTSDVIYTVELPNYVITPLEIRSGESTTFELINGMLYYNNVTVRINYGVTRNTTYYSYYKVNFKDGSTTTITLK